MSDDPLQTPIQFLPGVGPVRAPMFEKLGLQTVEDLLFYLPRDVLDLTVVKDAADLNPDDVQTVRGAVVDMDARQLKTGRMMSAVLLDCGSEYVRGLWFGQPWVLKKFFHGQNVLFSGKPKRHGGRWEISHPRVQVLQEDDGDAHGGVLPRYGLTEGLRMHEMRRVVRSAVKEFAHLVPDFLPTGFRDRLKLPPMGRALQQLHLPADMNEFESARRRLIFDDLLEFQLALALRRRAWKTFDQAPRLPVTGKIDARIRRLFRFDFTDGQDAAVREIAADLNSGRAMHRLLQADVGAGKTAIAVYAMLTAVAAGYQTVLMAPTELLANQHWGTIEEILSQSRVKRLLLTGSLTGKRRLQALSEIQSGQVDLVIGTQAVIQQGVRFAKLGLAIVDEQHKFGVAQRAHFSADNGSPHMLVMTATPIPRSLCLTQFGDLDITTISELPPGRQKVVTSRVAGKAVRSKAWDFIRKKLKEGRQAYVVCPRVSENADDNEQELAGSAEEVHRELSAGELNGFRVGIVHGRLDRRVKAETMNAFRDGEIQILVATTVVEVGVDVPNATMMVIQQAERFGLSQLHQLRGRISRGKFQGYCFLFSESGSDEAIQRLSALERTSDGFKIAEVDFEIRGPGDILGTRQHGELPLRVADLTRDFTILVEARKAAFRLVESQQIDHEDFAPLKIRVLDRFGQLMELPKSG